MNTHYSKKPVKLPLLERRQDFDDFKPKGLWYSVEGGWEEWCTSEMPGWLEVPYVYRVEIDPECKLLRLDSAQAIDSLVREYGEKGILKAPDWTRVAEGYDGVECSPYVFERRFDHLWYYAWDCSSGCLWRPKGTALYEIERVG